MNSSSNNRRPRKARAPKRGKRIDSSDQSSRIGTRGSDSLTWNILSGAIPRFGNTGRFDNQVHNVVQTIKIGSVLSSSNTLPTFAGVYFTANAHVTQFSQWAQVFDQYKFVELEAWLEPDFSNLNTATNTGLSKFYTVVDFDDANTPVAITDLMSYSNVIVSQAQNGHYRKWKPHVAVAAYQSTFTGYKNEPAGWIDCASGDVQHYGIKLAMDALASTLAMNVVCTLRVWVQFKNVR